MSTKERLRDTLSISLERRRETSTTNIFGPRQRIRLPVDPVATFLYRDYLILGLVGDQIIYVGTETMLVLIFTVAFVSCHFLLATGRLSKSIVLGVCLSALIQSAS